MTLLEYCIRQVGVFRGPNVVMTISLWALAMRQAEAAWPSLDERGDITARIRLYADVAVVSEATAWRHLSKFRKVFPDDVDPTTVVERLRLVERVTDLEHARNVGTAGFLQMGAA